MVRNLRRRSARLSPAGQSAGLLCCCALLTVNCRQAEAPGKAADAAPAPVVQEIECGPVHLTVTLDHDAVSIADTMTLTIEVLAEDGVDVQLPQFGNQLSAFTIRDFQRWPAVPEDGRKRWKEQYQLEIFLSGEYEIPALEVRFQDHRAGVDSAADRTIATDPIPIQVHSLLEGEFDPSQYKDIKGLVTLEAPSAWSRTWLLSLPAALAVILVLYWLYRRRRRAATVQIPAHEWALAQLRGLQSRQLIEKGQVHAFYFELSDIVRQYIEKRFSLRAPECTTKEFLEDLKDSAQFSDERRQLLREFLEAADLVKFALYEPERDQIEHALHSAEDFVHHTAPAVQESGVAA